MKIVQVGFDNLLLGSDLNSGGNLLLSLWPGETGGKGPNTVMYHIR